MSIYDSDATFERFMDDLQVLYRMKAGDTVSQADVDALNRVDRHWRDEEETLASVYRRAFKDGQTSAAGADYAALQERLDEKTGALSVARALSKFDERLGFIKGAAACREMMARFVEQGGDPVTANSIRLNWNPEWGEDPAHSKDAHSPGDSSLEEGG